MQEWVRLVPPVLVAGRVGEDGEVVGGTEVREVEEDTINTMEIEGEETRVSGSNF